MSYSSLTASTIISSAQVRRFVSACLKRDGFKWYDEPDGTGFAGTEYTGDDLDTVKFIVRGRRVFLRISRGGWSETHRVARVRYPDDMSSSYIFVDRV